MQSTTVTLTVLEAEQLGERALACIGFTDDEARVISASQIDAELCGYPALGLARMDGGNYPGFYAG